MTEQKVTVDGLLTLLRGPAWLSLDARIVISARALRTFGYGCTSILLAGMLTEDGVSAAGIGLLLGVAALGSVTASVGMGVFADRFGRRRSLFVTAGLMGVAGLVFAVCESYPVLLVAAFIGTISPSTNDNSPFSGVEQAILAQTCPAQHHTAVFARYSMSALLAGALGGLGAAALGLLTTVEPGDAAFLVYAALSAVIIALFRRLSPAAEPGSTDEFARERELQYTNAPLSWENVACEGHSNPGQKGIRWMRLSHARSAIRVRFDDPNLVSCAGLVPVMALAARCGLTALLTDTLVMTGKGAANAAAKIQALIGGMAAGADSISDMDLLRHGGMNRVFDRVRAPSTLGTFLRAFTFGHVRQLDAVAARLLARLAVATPLLPGADQWMFVDIDDTVRQTYGYAKQGAGRGYTGVKGLNALLAVFSTPTCAPVIAAARLRKGSTNSARGAGKLLADALATARRAGAGLARHAVVLVRADSAYYGFDIIDACRRAGARFSITARLTKTVVKAITSIDEQAWVAIRYPNAIFDEDEQRWVSDAEVAEVAFTAFTGRRKAEHVTARLIVRRVRRLNPKTVPAGQTEAFAVYRYHAVFTDSTEPMLAAEATHRDHAIVEQVIAELKNGPLAHLPSGKFAANAAWLVCAAISYNLTRAAGVLAGGHHTRARTGTLRDRLIHTPMRVAHSARRQDLHLPRDWPWEPGLDELFRRALHDPLPAAA